MFETNSIIRASAGTGKTYALATRFIRLMLIDRVRPETIVALTFSRAAAQEIYTKILDRLCQAATDGVDPKTGKAFSELEWEGLLADYRNGQIDGSAQKLAAILANPPSHGRDDFARLLRALVDVQHLGTIATLDSFILKFVRNFPKELGVQNAISVLDPIDENAAVEDAVARALSRTDGAGADLATAFSVTQKGECSRQCLIAIGNILAAQGWRNFVLSHPACVAGESRWTVASMAAQLGVDLNSVCPDLSMIPFNDMGRKNAVSREETFVGIARQYDGSKGPLDVPDGVKSLMQFFWTHPDATSYDYTYHKDFTLNCGAAGAAAIRGAIRHMMNVYLKRQLEIVEAKIRLVEAVEGEYERMTRRMGKLTFADFTNYSAAEEFSARGIANKNVEFRFDSKFDHWALDEFQDTSELQWRCLKELVREAAESSFGASDRTARTAMAVGDMKQSIYTWRGASARPFDDLASWEAFANFERNFNESYRYGPNIANFINRVFGPENITSGGGIPAVCADAVEAWRKTWSPHVSHQAADYLKVAVTPRIEDDGKEIGLLEALATEVRALWDRHLAEKSADTVGILVRNNVDGLKVAEYLRKKGMVDVVWEGMSPCGDDPIVQSVLSLLKLAEHPSDTAAWKTVSELMDLRSVLMPDDPSSATAASVSADVARLLTQQGLARTLKDWCGKLRAGGLVKSDGRASEMLCRLVELAVAFEGRATADGSISAFADFVAKSGKREIAASSDVIRVLTIHRSKGLGIDHVFVPLFEGNRATSAIDAPKTSTPLFDGGAWVLSHLQKGSEQFNAATKAAYEKMCSDRFAETLRTYYVALTRAKKSMVVIFPEEPKMKDESKKKGGEKDNARPGLLMRDLIRTAVGGVLPYEVGALPSLKCKPEERDETVSRHESWIVECGRVPVKRVTPSHGAGGSVGGRKAADLFDVDFGDAARKGVAKHADYATIAWDDAADKFSAAFAKPSPNATVWRERSYELFDAKTSTWESGQFDRVVFTGEAENRSATIYDFKTNAQHPGESGEAFAERMRGLYSAQMASYRQALHRLTKIPLERIKACLLLEATGTEEGIGERE